MSTSLHLTTSFILCNLLALTFSFAMITLRSISFNQIWHIAVRWLASVKSNWNGGGEVLRSGHRLRTTREGVVKLSCYLCCIPRGPIICWLLP